MAFEVLHRDSFPRVTTVLGVLLLLGSVALVPVDLGPKGWIVRAAAAFVTMLAFVPFAIHRASATEIVVDHARRGVVKRRLTGQEQRFVPFAGRKAVRVHAEERLLEGTGPSPKIAWHIVSLVAPDGTAVSLMESPHKDGIVRVANRLAQIAGLPLDHKKSSADR